VAQGNTVAPQVRQVIRELKPQRDAVLPRQRLDKPCDAACHVAHVDAVQASFLQQMLRLSLGQRFHFGW